MSLYNELRPMRLSDVAGQLQVTNVLSAQMKSGRFSNVYLFVGVRGTGKTTTARILARALNCQNKDGKGEPCGTCPACRAILAGTCPDVIELDAARNRSVEDARKLIEQTQYAPQSSKKRVFIIDEVHMFSTEAFNALLKTLEDPPKYCVFILCTTEEHRVPATIISRCQKFNFGNVDEETSSTLMSNALEERKIPYDLGALILIAKAAHGSVRDALSILDKCISDMGEEGISEELVRELQGIPEEQVMFDLLKGLAKLDAKTVLFSMQSMEKRGQSPVQIILNAQEILGDCIRYHALGIDHIYNVSGYKQGLIELCKDMSSDTAVSCMAMFVEAKKEINDIGPYTSLMARMIFFLDDKKKVVELDKVLKDAKAQLIELSARLAESDKLLEKTRRSLAEAEGKLQGDRTAAKTQMAQVETRPAPNPSQNTPADFDDSEFAQVDEQGVIEFGQLFGGKLPSKSSSSFDRNNADVRGAAEAGERSGRVNDSDSGDGFANEFFNW